MSKLKIDGNFGYNENCNLSEETLNTLNEKPKRVQLNLINEKYRNAQRIVVWPYHTDNKTITNLEKVRLVLEYGAPIKRVVKTIFVTPFLLFFMASKIEQQFDIYLVEQFPQEQVLCMFDDTTVVSYNFSEDHGQSEREFLIDIFYKWFQLKWKPNRIVLKNVLFLTHFSTSILRIIASFYKSMSVNNKGIIEIQNLKTDLDLPYIQNFWEKLNCSNCHSTMSFVELHHVNIGEFFDVITNYNAVLLMKYMDVTFEQLFVKIY